MKQVNQTGQHKEAYYLITTFPHFWTDNGRGQTQTFVSLQALFHYLWYRIKMKIKQQKIGITSFKKYKTSQYQICK